MTTTTTNVIEIPVLSPEEEDDIVLTRLTNDERPLRRVLKKFNAYTALAQAPPPIEGNEGAIPEVDALEEAREAFLLELNSFHLLLRKNAMICDAEARQVEEYERESQRINDERESQHGQIEQLKISLEHAQLERKRKMEYDAVAEKINGLPTREELQNQIEDLESDMRTIKEEHDAQNRNMQHRKTALDAIVADLGSLRLMGKDTDASITASPVSTPLPDPAAGEVEELPLESSSEVKLEGDEEKSALSAKSTPVPEHTQSAEDDIEMGEVAEERTEARMKRKIREELEEGEATDASSELSELPDDV